MKALIDSIRANGGFRPGNESCPGAAAVDALRSAFRDLGYDLDPDGHLRPTLLECLEGADLTEALEAYVRRIRLGVDDAPLVIGSSKSIEEATARHVLREVTGKYPAHADMRTTLYQAFEALGLSTPQLNVIESLPGEPRAALEQAVLVLAFAVNRFRNAEGEGHGRPDPSTATPEDASLVSNSAAIVTQLLLDSLTRC